MDDPEQNWSSTSSQPLGHAHEGIKFMEDDESSSEIIGSKTPEIVFTAPENNGHLEVPTATAKSLKEDTDDNYMEISCSSAFLETKPKEKKSPQKFRKSAEIVLSLLSRSPSFRRNKGKDNEKIYIREESTYCSIPETAEGESSGRRKISGSSNPDVSGRKSEDDEQILEALRQVVRKCTNPEPLKRPSSSDVFDLVSFYDKS